MIVTLPDICYTMSMKKPHQTKKPVDVGFNFRLRKKDLQLIRKAAEKHNVSVSSFIRESVIEAAKVTTP